LVEEDITRFREIAARGSRTSPKLISCGWMGTPDTIGSHHESGLPSSPIGSEVLDGIGHSDVTPKVWYHELLWELVGNDFL